ncbi:ATP-binding cassette domain-containing protein [Romboutsia sp. CE17]|uniref:ABC transporter ATP-binding protein/permease n=1 Tax=Romboutsia sp. CE17 TaxID=2724150 RepID=UPI001442D7E9|nr:ABC transporter ATP-binding protein/permease [Romboutsia sp. CE17]QJA08160.1 ATP-binding cassette domain-containing protein [Romboutsia sp. CE17]
MLTLKNIKKSYTTGSFTQTALDGVSVNFRKNEFVTILGPSGSGKTTCLNVIGGLDKYDSGDLIINGRSTKEFKDTDWDAYRNNSIGFIFQSYNLINHLDIISNVEMGMTLSGVSPKEKREKALEVLERVGLKEHVHKKPNQLSGGQMQRVAIARALANDPDIILADEPTGALDTKTSVQIMELIKDIAKDKLVIMVTHNPELAHDYADRIIEFRDGNIISDSNILEEGVHDGSYSLKKTSMNFLTALKLSATNIKTKKGRTFLTAFASSIGIIGIAVILSLSTGFKTKIEEVQSDTLSEYPITITQSSQQIDEETIENMRGEMQSSITGNVEYVDSDEVYLYDISDTIKTHVNNFSEEFIEHLNDIDKNICSSIGYTRIASMNLIRKIDDTYKSVSFASENGNLPMQSATISSYPEMIDTSNGSYIEKNYDLLAGKYPTEDTDLVLVVDSKNRVDINLLKSLGIDTKDISSIDFDELVGMEFKLIDNDDYYEKTNFGTYMPTDDLEKAYKSKNSTTLTLKAIVRSNPDSGVGILANGIAYSDKLTELVVENGLDSEIVKAQKDADYNVLTKEELDEKSKSSLISYLGGDSTPYAIMIYPKNFDSKDQVVSYLEDYNSKIDSEDDTIVYTDLAQTMSDMSGGIMDAITIVLVAFASISLVVSLIMVGIITYISVLERTKEIGILRALGARKKDITRVFNAETFIIGTCSGLLGIIIAWGLTFPMNDILYNMTELENIAYLNPLHAIMLLTISVVLTMIGGWIPSKFASKKDPVESLRS